MGVVYRQVQVKRIPFHCIVRERWMPEELKIKSFLPEDICWLTQVYKNAPLTERCLESIRNCYPNSPILVVNDGDDTTDWTAVCQKYSAVLHNQERFFLMHYGGLVWQKRFEYFLATDAKWLLKVDTDTRVNFALPYIPKGGIFTNVIWKYDGYFESVAGGCIGFDRATAKFLVDTGMLLDGKFKDEMYLRSITPEYQQQMWIDKGMIADDNVLSEVIKHSGLSVTHWPDIFIMGGGSNDVPDNYKLQYCITHPHKGVV